jgi:integrase/recombinase XerD
MLTVYRRHLKRCEHRNEGRAYRRCRCPLHAEGLVGAVMMRCSLATRDWERAQEIVRKWEAEGRGAPPMQADRQEVMTIAKACDLFIADAEARNLKHDTVYKYKLLFQRLRDFALLCRIEGIAEIGFSELARFRASWKDGNLAALKKLERMRGFFKFVRDNGWRADNPADKLKSPRVTMRPTLPFTEKEMVKILNAIAQRVEKVQPQGKLNARRLRALVLFLRYSGLRIGDAVSCPVDRVSDGKLRIYTQKTGTHVHCPLPDFVVNELEATPRVSDRYWFWTGYGSVKRAASKWQSLLREVCQKAGVVNGHAHRFRDTFAVELLLAGVPVERIAILLGHSSVRITEKHYSPWVRERQEQAEADVRRSWKRDPLVLMEGAVEVPGEPNHTPDTRGNGERIM